MLIGVDEDIDGDVTTATPLSDAAGTAEDEADIRPIQAIVASGLDITQEKAGELRKLADNAIDVLEDALPSLLPAWGVMAALGAIAMVRRLIRVPDDYAGDAN